MAKKPTPAPKATPEIDQLSGVVIPSDFVALLRCASAKFTAKAQGVATTPDEEVVQLRWHCMAMLAERVSGEAEALLEGIG